MNDLLKWFVDNDLNVSSSGIKNTIIIGDKKYLVMSNRSKVLKYSSKNKAAKLNLNSSEVDIFGSGDVDFIIFKMGSRFFYTDCSENVSFNQLRYLGSCSTKHQFAVPNLGIRGNFELCNGSGSYKDWCAKAKFLGLPAIGICEKNTLAGVLEFQKNCHRYGLKPILGETVSVSSDKDIYEVSLYVSNEEGWRNILRINKEINVTNVDNRVVSEKNLIKNSGGLYCMISSSTPLSRDMVSIYKNSNFIETYYQFDLSKYSSPYRDSEILSNIESYYKNYSNDLGALIVNYSFYLEKEYSHIRHKLNKIYKTFEYQTEDSYFKTPTEAMSSIKSVFKEDSDYKKFLIKSLTNTIEVEKGCNFTIETSTFKLPEYKMTAEEVEKYSNPELMIRSLIKEGLKKKILDLGNFFGKSESDYLDRVESELKVIKKGGFIDYFLILWDICMYADRNGILRGIGRGSAGGSLVAYLLDLTRVNPMQYNLIFERFLNEGRIGGSLPDIDTDFAGERRGEVKRYMEDKYGKHNVCSIGTYGTFKPRQALSDLCRLDKVPTQTAQYFSSLISPNSSSYGDIFNDAVSKEPLKKFVNEKFDLIEDIMIIDGQCKNQSVHAAGVIITPEVDASGNPMQIYDWMPVKSMDGVLVSEWEKDLLEDAGYLKEDILGIKQLDKFDLIFKLIESRGGKAPDFETIDYNDPEVLKMFGQGYNQDLFHFGSKGLSKYSMQVDPDSFEDLISIISLYRPGVMKSGSHEKFIQLKRGEIEPEYDFGMEEITKSTLSLVVYQEQIMMAVQSLGSMSLVDADNVRKAMGKKDMNKMEGYKKVFIDSAVSKGCDEFEAESIWNKLARFAEYGFNRSHAAAYAMTGYFCQYLKKYHTMEYWAVSLSYSKSDEVVYRVGEIQESDNGINVLGPDINKSGSNFEADFKSNNIYWSIKSIDQIGPIAMEAIINCRDEGGSFYSFEEFYKRIDKSVVNKRVISNMIICGCFDSLFDISQEDIHKRVIIFKELQRISGNYEIPDIKTKQDFLLAQKSLCGYGFLDFLEITAKSGIPNGVEKYTDPIGILMEDNVGCHVVCTGIVHDIFVKKSVRGDFAKVMIDNNNQIIEVTLWSDSWKIFGSEVGSSKGKIVSFSGNIVYDTFSASNTVTINDTDSLVVIDKFN